MREDPTRTNRRTTVAEAADAQGVGAEAVRGRIRRGTLPVEREGDKVYVMLTSPAQDRPTGDQSRTTADRPDDRTDLLIAELQDRVRSLEDANRENRRIIAALTSRIPAIEAPSGPTEAREPVEEEPEVAHDAPVRYPTNQGPQRITLRDLTRRIFRR